MMHVVSYTQAAFAEVARKVEVFADAEDLPAHGAAIARRFLPIDPRAVMPPFEKFGSHGNSRRSLSFRCGLSWSVRGPTAPRSWMSLSA